MGMIIPVQVFSPEDISALMKPIIYCYSDIDLIENAFSINVLLAKKLLECNPKRRTMRLEKCFNQVLSQLPDGATIKDFDVMFNPEYKIDVLRIMISACKIKPFCIIWPGKFEGGKLYYAENGFSDYKVFPVNNYDVTCIVEGGIKDEIF